MADFDDNPIAGTGAEMLPEKGNPFFEHEPLEDSGIDEATISWEQERINDLASSSEGRSSRIPRSETREDILELRNTKVKDTTSTAHSGTVEGHQQAVELAPAHLADAPHGKKEEKTAHQAEKESSALSPSPTKPSIENQRRLLHRIEDAHWKISDVIDDLDTAKELLDMVQQAIYFINSKEADTGKAERTLYEVEYRISLAERTRRWSTEAGRRVLWYEITWTVVIIAVFIVLPLLRILPEAVNAVIAALLGSLGGIFSAMFSLWRHVSIKQDYNPRHNPWYFMQPITGMAIGGFVYLIFLSISQFNGASGENSGWTMLIFLLSAIIGSQQAFIYSLPARIRKRLTGKS